MNFFKGDCVASHLIWSLIGAIPGVDIWIYYYYFFKPLDKTRNIILLVFSFVLFLVKLPMLAGASYVVGIWINKYYVYLTKVYYIYGI